MLRLSRRSHAVSIEKRKHWIFLDALLGVRVGRAVFLTILPFFAAGAVCDKVVHENSVLYTLAVGHAVLARFVSTVHGPIGPVAALFFIVILIIII